jgi:hypothetical protein
MAEATTNTNPDRPATDNDYQPVSVTAVVAFIVAILLVIFFLLLGGNAFLKRKPFYSSWLLAMAIIGFALAVAARVQIRRSEGTRSGLKLATIAWWLTIMVGAGYGAYLGTSRYALDKQSREYAQDWFSLLANLSDPNPVEREGSYYAAFWRTLDPTRRATISERDKDTLELEFPKQMDPFRRSQLVRYYQRSRKGDIKIDHESMTNWEEIPNGYRVDQLFQLRSPEGVFSTLLRMDAREDAQGRSWRIDGRDETKFKVITDFGYATETLQADARKFADDWLVHWAAFQWDNTYLLTLPPDQRPTGEFVTNEELTTGLFFRPHLCLTGLMGTYFLPEVTAARPPVTNDDKRKAELLDRFQLAPFVAGGGVVPFLRSQLTFAELESRGFFKLLPDREQGSPKWFAAIWSVCRVIPNSGMRAGSTEAPTIIISPTEIRVTIPVLLDLSPSFVDRRMGTAKITVRSTDKTLLQAVEALYEAGKADPWKGGSMDIYNSLPPRNWQIYSIESNLKGVRPERPGPPGG